MNLEQSFKTAADWLGVTGQGVEDERNFRDAITTRCPYYYDLYELVIDRDSITPLMLNTDNLAFSNESSDDEDSLSGVSDEPMGMAAVTTLELPIVESLFKPSAEASVAESPIPLPPTGTSPFKPPGNERKRRSSSPRSIGLANKRNKDTAGELTTTTYQLANLKKSQLAQEKELQLQTLKLEREKAAAVAMEIDARGRINSKSDAFAHPIRIV
ncbi:hypothetical protein PF005_g2449 [Phytophthora fragariae]|uniref:No apical meristem-associated C-terminal domain-containing protein n=1 Tax=Phytophthora fragariae TaxID=53985 RepID=A0A6A3TFZ5_9STRA|nr:hypothetical protein PF009_g4309 [Phytophthora fragariae]KAE9025126.1 hypothetical protein PF011_g3173 [Phytophthora fragariae]KAE9135606.1 hypothetical protein PF010_g2032 [Phytophthora fragariae]KAE9135912.1 hypothetical protein PF007_g2395 [Phytophthora fragariae]KAE9154057.1 hypothetical protein PF006_g1877 [Phytophthora fragariae]